MSIAASHLLWVTQASLWCLSSIVAVVNVFFRASLNSSFSIKWDMLCVHRVLLFFLSIGAGQIGTSRSGLLAAVLHIFFSCSVG